MINLLISNAFKDIELYTGFISVFSDMLIEI